MVELDEQLRYLRKLTEDLAVEVKDEEYGFAYEFCKRLADNIKSFVIMVDKDETVLYMNPSFQKNLKKIKAKLEVGQKWYEGWGMDKSPKDFPLEECIKSKMMLIRDYQSPLTGRFLHAVLIPLSYNGVSGAVCIFEYGNDE